MRVDIDTLSGVALDWVVAKCTGVSVTIKHWTWTSSEKFLAYVIPDIGYEDVYTPSTDWHQGGELLESNKVCVDTGHSGVWLACIKQNYDDGPEYMAAGLTPLIAAMRCYVKSKLGDTVEVPDELCP